MAFEFSTFLKVVELPEPPQPFTLAINPGSFQQKENEFDDPCIGVPNPINRGQGGTTLPGSAPLEIKLKNAEYPELAPTTLRLIH